MEQVDGQRPSAEAALAPERLGIEKGDEQHLWYGQQVNAPWFGEQARQYAVEPRNAGWSSEPQEKWKEGQAVNKENFEIPKMQSHPRKVASISIPAFEVLRVELEKRT